MPVKGEMLIGATSVRGSGKAFQGIDAATRASVEPAFNSASLQDVQRACELARAAFRPYRDETLERRARFLEQIAENLLGLRAEIVARAMTETGLPQARLEGELARTTGQLKLFAGVVRDGAFLDARIDTAQPNRKPAPRPDLRAQHIGLGPVAVFGASNFPLAFSVAGGDTASALAAGCPVIVKAHPAHPGTSELAGQAIQAAVQQMGLPEGTFSMLYDSSFEIGVALVAAPEIQAVGFTGSRTGGLALLRIAQQRPVPIPVYAEMSSINPIILLPHALKARGPEIAKAFVASLTLGVGQFCTNPGLVLALDTPELDAFLATAGEALAACKTGPMLTAGIAQAYNRGVAIRQNHPDIGWSAAGSAGDHDSGPGAIFSIQADRFRQSPELSEEVFGPTSIVVRCKSIEDMRDVLENIEGQLTIALHLDDDDVADAAILMPVAEEKAGRILCNGFGTGVEVAHATVHGGPFPSTSDGRTTSVGSLAIRRFLRPVCYQDLPGPLVPQGLQNQNALKIPRLVDGKIELG